MPMGLFRHSGDLDLIMNLRRRLMATNDIGHDVLIENDYWLEHSRESNGIKGSN